MDIYCLTILPMGIVMNLVLGGLWILKAEISYGYPLTGDQMTKGK